MTVQIQQQNELLNKRAREVSALFAKGGFQSCVLKGQSIAGLYNLSLDLNEDSNISLFRQSGDIDLWVEGERERVLDFIKGKEWKMGETVIHHTDVEIFSDVSVEVHHFPSYSFSPVRWRKYQEWFRTQAKKQFQLMDESLGFCSPSLGFNLVYCVLHIFRHVFHEGIGLRQLMDYYMVLMATGRYGTQEFQIQAMRTLEWFGLARFTAAVMYVEQEVFGLSQENMLCKPDKEAGRYLLDEILRAGNFGQYDPRIREAHSGGSMKLYMKNVKRVFGMVRYYPSEVLWAPFWKVGHFVWRKVKGFE